VVRLLTGEEDLSTWSDEEIWEGRKKQGGPDPTVIPLKIHREFVRRIKEKAAHKFAAELEIAIQKHIDMIMDERLDEDGKPIVPPGVKLKAIIALEERVLGKAPETVVLHDGDAPFRRLLANAIVGTEEQARQIIEVKAVEKSNGGSKDRTGSRKGSKSSRED
jgi:hypothetical protein